jgi:membrane protease YdiL (CAAX protease family)
VLLAELLVFIGTSGSLAGAPSPLDSPTEAAAMVVLVPGLITSAISLGLILVLRWQTGAGLGFGWMSPWGVIPLAVLLVGTILTVRMPSVAAAESSFLGVLLLGLALAALAEEILFRGFLTHGLARRLGGREAVLLGSALFAAAHIPSLLQQRLDGGGVAVTLVVLFGLGVLLCRIRAETGSLWFATGVHALWNFVTIGVVGSAFSMDDIPSGFVALKLVPVLIGLWMAVRLHRSGAAGPRTFRGTGAPPMPAAFEQPVASRFVRPLPPPPRPD